MWEKLSVLEPPHPEGFSISVEPIDETGKVGK